MTAAGVAVSVGLAVLLGGAGPASSQCFPAVRYHGEMYVGVRQNTPVRIGRFVGSAAFPGCNDYVNPDGTPANEPDTPVDVYRAGSVDPAIALMTRQDSTIYLRQGFLPVLPSHPLHKAIFAGRGLPPEPNCHRLTRLSGHLFDWPGFDVLFVQVSHHRGFFPVSGRPYLTVFLRESTGYTGSRYLGLPFINPGARVQIAGAFCADRAHLFIAQIVRASNATGSSASRDELSLRG